MKTDTKYHLCARRASRKALGTIELPKGKLIDYPLEHELFNRILMLVHEYDGEISTASAIGILELVKQDLSIS